MREIAVLTLLAAVLAILALVGQPHEQLLKIDASARTVGKHDVGLVYRCDRVQAKQFLIARGRSVA